MRSCTVLLFLPRAIHLRVGGILLRQRVVAELELCSCWLRCRFVWWLHFSEALHLLFLLAIEISLLGFWIVEASQPHRDGNVKTEAGNRLSAERQLHSYTEAALQPTEAPPKPTPPTHLPLQKYTVKPSTNPYTTSYKLHSTKMKHERAEYPDRVGPVNAGGGRLCPKNSSKPIPRYDALSSRLLVAKRQSRVSGKACY